MAHSPRQITETRSPLRPCVQASVAALAFTLLFSVASCGGTAATGATGSGGASSGPTGSGGASGGPSCTAVCANIATVCGTAPSDCAQTCAGATSADRTCAANATSCASASACGSGASSSSGGGGSPGSSSSGSPSSSSGAMAGTCPSNLGSGESCPDPCLQAAIDGAEQCLLTCPNGGACNDATYNYCDTSYPASPLCVPTCNDDATCTGLGFNGCGMLGFPNAHCI